MIRFPTGVASIVGRWAVNGEADLPAVAALQAGLTLTPLGAGAVRGLPASNPSVAEDLAYFERLRVWMQAFPPAERDRDYQQRLEPLGLFAPESPYVDSDPELTAALRDGLAQGKEQIEHALKHSPSPKQNGWDLTFHVFDYNLDFRRDDRVSRARRPGRRRGSSRRRRCPR